MLLTTIVQVLIALVIVIVLFVVAFYIYNREYISAIQTASKLQKRVDIFKGIKDLKNNKNELYDTADKTHPTYKDLQLSVNQKGGAEFTYNFWLYKDNSISLVQDSIPVKTDQGLRTDDIVLLLKGVKQSYTYRGLCGKTKTDVLVKCPLIKLQADLDVLAVELNTVTGPDSVHEMSRNTCSDASKDWKKMNAHMLAIEGLTKPNFDKKWFMVSVVMQDVTPVDPLPFRNRVRVLIYVNGVLELDRYVDGRLGSVGDDPSIIRQNMGALYVAPSIKITREGQAETTVAVPDNIPEKSLYMADLSYFNYALPIEEIKSLHASGFTKSVAPSVADTENTRNAISQMEDAVAFTDGSQQLREF